MKKFGRLHRPFFRVCVTDVRSPRDGRVLEEVGYYDPMVPETDARTKLNGERIDYWVGVGAQPSDKVAVLIKKYGSKGTHLEQQKAALERLTLNRRRPEVPTDLPKPQKQQPKRKRDRDKVQEQPQQAAPPVPAVADTAAAANVESAAVSAVSE
jgi:small subunit ribosomal protein S16